jgi:hypothetical protein
VTGENVPIPPASRPEPPPPVAAPAEDWSDAADRSVGRARTCAGWAAGCTAVLLLVCGGGALFAAWWLDARVRDAEAEVRASEEAREERREAEALLDVLALRVRADAVELPVVLPEAPPKDPWGNPVRWSRRKPDSGTLTSAGPDGRFGTRDDVTRVVGRE